LDLVFGASRRFREPGCFQTAVSAIPRLSLARFG